MDEQLTFEFEPRPTIKGIDYAKKNIILVGAILGGILSLTSCGPQERGNVPNTTESRGTEEYTRDIQVDAGDGEAATETLSEMAESIHETAETASEIPTEEDSIDVGEISGGAEAYLADFDIHPLYAVFLRNEVSVPNPFVSGSELSFFDDRDYAQEEHVFEYAVKCFSLVDVNNDGITELIFKIYNSPDELMYILGTQGDQLVCYDVQETHTNHMSFWIFDNGIVTWSQNYDGAEKIYYTYDKEGSPHELIHFVWEESESDSGLYYDYYYMDGDENAICSLQSNEEYEALISPYKGGEPEWFFCDSFADIPVE